MCDAMPKRGTKLQAVAVTVSRISSPKSFDRRQPPIQSVLNALFLLPAASRCRYYCSEFFRKCKYYFRFLCNFRFIGVFAGTTNHVIASSEAAVKSPISLFYPKNHTARCIQKQSFYVFLVFWNRFYWFFFRFYDYIALLMPFRKKLGIDGFSPTCYNVCIPHPQKRRNL